MIAFEFECCCCFFAFSIIIRRICKWWICVSLVCLTSKFIKDIQSITRSWCSIDQILDISRSCSHFFLTITTIFINLKSKKKKKWNQLLKKHKIGGTKIISNEILPLSETSWFCCFYLFVNESFTNLSLIWSFVFVAVCWFRFSLFLYEFRKFKSRIHSNALYIQFAIFAYDYHVLQIATAKRVFGIIQLFYFSSFTST